MKTTINIPDALAKKAKVEAAMRGTTLKDLVVRGLQLAIHSPDHSPDAAKNARADRVLKALESHTEAPVQPLSRKDIYE